MTIQSIQMGRSLGICLATNVIIEESAEESVDLKKLAAWLTNS